MIGKIISKTITPAILFLLCIVYFSACTNQTPETTASISFTLSSEFVEKINNAARASDSKDISDKSQSRSVTSSGSSESDYLMDISMKGDFEEMSTVHVRAGSKVTFSNVTIGSSVYITGFVYELSEDANGTKKRTDLFSGSSENLVVKSGENKISLPLKKVKSEAGQGQGQTLEGTATKYTVREWWQLTEGEGYSLHDSYEVEADSGSKTQATAKTYTGFTAQSPIEQQTIAADGTTIVNIYYDRLTYTVTYNSNGKNSINIPSTKEYRYGAKVQVAFDTSDVTGFVFNGWFTDAACTTLYDSTEALTGDLVLYAKWLKAADSGITVIFNYYATDINVTMEKEGSVYTFTAPVAGQGEDPYEYEWYLDGQAGPTTNELTIDVSSDYFVAGVPYDLVLYLTKNSDNSSYRTTYSYFVQIKKD